MGEGKKIEGRSQLLNDREKSSEVSRALDSLIRDARVFVMSADLNTQDVHRNLERRPQNKRRLGVSPQQPVALFPLTNPVDWKASLLHDAWQGIRLACAFSSRAKLEEIHHELKKKGIKVLVIQG